MAVRTATSRIIGRTDLTGRPKSNCDGTQERNVARRLTTYQECQTLCHTEPRRMRRPETLFRLHSLAWTVLGLSLATGCSTGTGALGRWPQTLSSATNAPHIPMANTNIDCTSECSGTQSQQTIDPWGRWNGEEDPNVTRAFAKLEHSAPSRQYQQTTSWIAQRPEIAEAVSTTAATLSDALNHPQTAQQVDHENPARLTSGIANSALPSTIDSSSGNWSTPKSITTFSR